MIKNIVFDVGNVLIDFCWEKAMQDLGFSSQAIRDLGEHMISSPRWKALDLGIEEPAKVIEEFKQQNPAYKEEIQMFFDHPDGLIECYAHSGEWLQDLKKRGYNTYLLSNYPAWMFSIHEKQYSFLPFVDGKIVSGFVNLIKPDPAIYELLTDTYGLKPEECVFLDDRPENIETAKALGWQGIVVENQEKAIEELNRMLRYSL